MTSKKTIEWMQQENILKHWILPEQGLNKGAKYEQAPPGNAPELNTLESNCNCDIHCAVLEHACITSTMNKTDALKFSVSSPKHQDNAYLRLLDPQFQLTHSMSWDAGVPSSKRIVIDMMRIPKYSVLKRYKARGCVVPGCGTHKDDMMKD
eukprot:8646648-Ditylum_brightwellii.AAC.1